MADAPFPPFHVLREFLDPDDRDALLAMLMERRGDFRPSTTFHEGQEVVMETRRVSHKIAFPPGPVQDAFAARVRERTPELFAPVGVAPFAVARYELEVVAHGDGAHLSRHIDTLTGVHGMGRTDRVISGVYYLHREPRGFTGGDLRLFRFGSSTDAVAVPPARNSFVAFPSFASHDVTRVHCASGRFEDARFAVNCWFHRSREGPVA